LNLFKWLGKNCHFEFEFGKKGYSTNYKFSKKGDSTNRELRGYSYNLIIIIGTLQVYYKILYFHLNVYFELRFGAHFELVCEPWTPKKRDTWLLLKSSNDKFSYAMLCESKLLSWSLSTWENSYRFLQSHIQFMNILIMNDGIFQSCLEWESPVRSIIAFISFLSITYYFEPYMFPVALLLMFVKNYFLVGETYKVH